MFADEIRRQAEAAPRAALPAIAASLWGALADGKITETEANELSELITARKAAALDHRMPPRAGDAAPLAAAGVVRRYGSKPRTDASMERRRRWAASGRLPPALACRFTLAEQAVLALVAAETSKRGDCRMAIEHMAAVAGVSRSTVKTAIREARKFGLVTVEERRLTGWRNDTNVLRIVSPEWLAWMRLARRETRFSDHGGGVKSATTTHTGHSDSGTSRPADTSKGCRGAADRTIGARLRDSGRSTSRSRAV